MKKSNSMDMVICALFLWIGVGFIGLSLLAFGGVMTFSTESAIQDPIVAGYVFAGVGAIMCISQAVFRIMKKRQDGIEEEIIARGMLVNATVERVEYQSQIRVMKKSPYIIYYNYQFGGKIISKKSKYIWEKPNYKMGDYIEVYVDDIGRIALKI